MDREEGEATPFTKPEHSGVETREDPAGARAKATVSMPLVAVLVDDFFFFFFFFFPLDEGAEGEVSGVRAELALALREKRKRRKRVRHVPFQFRSVTHRYYIKYGNDLY